MPLGIISVIFSCYARSRVEIDLICTELVMYPNCPPLLMVSPYGIWQTIIFLPCGFFFLSFFFSLPNLSRRRLDVCANCHTSTRGVALISANFRCRSETRCTRLAVNTGCKKVAKNRHLGPAPSHNFVVLYLRN